MPSSLPTSATSHILPSQTPPSQILPSPASPSPARLSPPPPHNILLRIGVDILGTFCFISPQLVDADSNGVAQRGEVVCTAHSTSLNWATPPSYTRSTCTAPSSLLTGTNGVWLAPCAGDNQDCSGIPSESSLTFECKEGFTEDTPGTTWETSEVGKVWGCKSMLYLNSTSFAFVPTQSSGRWHWDSFRAGARRRCPSLPESVERPGGSLAQVDHFVGGAP